MVKKIMWDKGHGGFDPGAVSNGLKEADLTNDIVDHAMIYMTLNYTGFEQRATRSIGQTLDLMRRDDEADAWGADVFVSVHINAGGGTGFESFVYNRGVSPSTYALQNIIHNEVITAMRKFGDVIDRGKKKANFAVLRETNMDAVLTENLFIDTNADANKLKSQAFVKAVGEAHARGVAKFLGLPEKPKPKPPGDKLNVITGWYNEGSEGLALLEEFLKKRKLYYRKEKIQGNKVNVITGWYREGSSGLKELENFLKTKGWYYRKEKV